MDLTHIPIIDHHAHPLLQPAAVADQAGFRQWFTESTDPEIHSRHVPNSLYFRTAIRWLAELLDCDPSLPAVLAARAAQPYHTWTQTLFRQANIRLVLCDYGYGGDQALDHQAMQVLLPCEVRPILRLESLAESLIQQHTSFGDLAADFAQQVGAARANGYVALKSIAAYRSGLAIAEVSPTGAAQAFADVKTGSAGQGRVRLTAKPLIDYLVHLAVAQAEQQQLPVQFHTGFGDQDADLLWANPLHLRALIESTRAPLVLLHAGWPYYREAAHLAALYPHVWLDLSLAIPFATTGIPAMIRDILGMAPFSKVLFATDAFTMPEVYWLAARWGRWGLGRVLAELVADGFLAEPEAYEVATAILAGNAFKLYGLDAEGS